MVIVSTSVTEHFEKRVWEITKYFKTNNADINQFYLIIVFVRVFYNRVILKFQRQALLFNCASKPTVNYMI